MESYVNDEDRISCSLLNTSYLLYTYIFKIRTFLGCRTCTGFGDTRWFLVPVSLPNPVLTRHQTSWRRVRSTTKHRDDNSNHDNAFDICFCSFANTYNNQIRQISLSLYHPFNGVFFLSFRYTSFTYETVSVDTSSFIDISAPFESIDILTSTQPEELHIRPPHPLEHQNYCCSFFNLKIL